MKFLDIETWNRREHFEYFKQLADPSFSVCVTVDVTKAHALSKEKSMPFFLLYLYAAMKAINGIENFKYRITKDDRIRICDAIHASATIMRPDTTFGFSFIEYSEDLNQFCENFKREKERVLHSTDLFSPVVSEDTVYLSLIHI